MTELNGIVLSRLPVLPLRGLTAFPNMIVHFDVGRMMSIRALEAAMKNGQTIFLTAQRELKTDTPTPSDLYQIGTICQIRQILRLPGDNIRVLVEGKTRALAHNFIAVEKDEDCMYAEVEELEDYVYGVTERRAQALVRTAQERFGEYAQYASRLSPDVELTVAEGGDPGYLADYIAQNIPVDVAAKQEILEELGITRRLVMVIRMLGEETEVLKIENEIQDELKTQIDKNQKEYYLREQIKVIQTELGEQDVAAEAESYRTRVLDLKLPKECEDKLIREVDRFAKLSGSTAEQGVVRTYLDTVLDLPWNKKSEERHDLAEAQAILDRDHYGMEKVKERIMEFLAVKSLAPDLKGQVLCLVGPPGVGKTSIAKSVAEAMGRNYTRMSLGGVRDEADIRGHRKTYIGAMPGRIMDALRRAGKPDPRRVQQHWKTGRRGGRLGLYPHPVGHPQPGHLRHVSGAEPGAAAKPVSQQPVGGDRGQLRCPAAAGLHRRRDGGILLRPQRRHEYPGKLHHDRAPDHGHSPGDPSVPADTGARQAPAAHPGRGAAITQP